MEIIENNAIKLRVKNPSAVTNAIRKSTILEDGDVLVHWGIKEAQVLKGLGIDIPSPINTYEWTGKHKPFKHQIKTSSFLTLNKKACCFNEQGTGKTASVIWASDFLIKQGIIKRVLVVCPLSIMQSAWLQDLFTFAMHRHANICYGTRDKRKQIINSKAEYIVINYDGVEIVEDEIASGGFDLIVVDEANAYKNTTTKRWKVLNRLVDDKKWVWLLTGTPASQSPVDAYGLAKLVNPSGVPRFAGRWKDMVMNRVSQFTWILKPNAKDLVHRVLQPAIRFTKEQCLDLPSLTYQTREVPLTKQQQKYYKLLKTQMVVQAAGEDISVVNAAAGMNKLLQLSGGAVYSDAGEIISFDVKSRFKILEEILEETANKVVLFVPYRHAILLLKEALEKKKHSCEVINGDVPASKRASIFNNFQTKDDPKILIIQPQSASHGVTLHRADTIIYWSPVMSVETYLQCNARAHRAGQKNPVTVYHLEGSEVERKIYKMLQNKIDIHSNIINLYDEVTK